MRTTPRRLGTVAALVAVAVLTSGCSVLEVQMWFNFTRHETVSREQAKALADVVNATRPAACHPSYVGGCMPDNVTAVHCVGEPGAGPAVRGPFTRVWYDAYELDHDNDMKVCDEPVGAFDLFGQKLGHIRVRGWAFDPNTSAPIDLRVFTNNGLQTITADESRADLEAAVPGIGSNHGFDVFTTAGSPGTTVFICLRASIHGKPGQDKVIGCKAVVVHDPSPFRADTGTLIPRDALALLEGADLVPGGIRVRGWAADEDGAAAIAGSRIWIGDVDGNPLAARDLAPYAVADPELNAASGAPAGTQASFDFVAQVPYGTPHTVCILPAFSCRSVNT